ncbi:MAG: TIGR04255 family protein [Acidobacteria bacterium]|nr:TIGR04255 family protein [Acidobacteriota bacterium]
MRSPQADMIQEGYGTLTRYAMAGQELTSEPLPDSPRVIYAKNPLVEVICQVRFPPILKIAAEPPAAFQERIRSEYPLLTEKQPDAIELPQGVPPVVAQVIRSSLPKGKLAGYEFVSADEHWKVTLTRDFLALSTSAYRRWEDFRAHLDGPMKALIEVYAPAFLTRIGLRYQDLIRRSALNAPGTNWRDLVKPHFAGVLAAPEVAGAVDEAFGQILIRFPHFKSKARVNYGVVKTADTSEECFLIDNDFYTEERTNISDVDNIFGYFNRQSGRLFRWCIQDRLHEAMEPASVTAEA